MYSIERLLVLHEQVKASHLSALAHYVRGVGVTGIRTPSPWLTRPRPGLATVLIHGLMLMTPATLRAMADPFGDYNGLVMASLTWLVALLTVASFAPVRALKRWKMALALVVSVGVFVEQLLQSWFLGAVCLVQMDRTFRWTQYICRIADLSIFTVAFAAMFLIFVQRQVGRLRCLACLACAACWSINLQAQYYAYNEPYWGQAFANLRAVVLVAYVTGIHEAIFSLLAGWAGLEDLIRPFGTIGMTYFHVINLKPRYNSYYDYESGSLQTDSFGIIAGVPWTPLIEVGWCLVGLLCIRRRFWKLTQLSAAANIDTEDVIESAVAIATAPHSLDKRAAARIQLYSSLWRSKPHTVSSHLEQLASTNVYKSSFKAPAGTCVVDTDHSARNLDIQVERQKRTKLLKAQLSLLGDMETWSLRSFGACTAIIFCWFDVYSFYGYDFDTTAIVSAALVVVLWTAPVFILPSPLRTVHFGVFSLGLESQQVMIALQLLLWAVPQVNRPRYYYYYSNSYLSTEV